MSEKKTGRRGNKGKNKNEGKEKVDTAPAEDTSEQGKLSISSTGNVSRIQNFTVYAVVN